MIKSDHQKQKKQPIANDQSLLESFLHFDKIDTPLFSEECASLLRVSPEAATRLQAQGALRKSTSFRLPVTQRSAASNLYDVFALETKWLLEEEFGSSVDPSAEISRELDDVAFIEASLRGEVDSGFISTNEAYEIIVDSISADLGLVEGASNRLPREVAERVLNSYLELSSEAQKIINGDDLGDAPNDP
jgi:hypothetical protein